MRTVSTDDEARRQVFVWLGPVDAALMVPARLAAVAWAVVLIPTFIFLAWVLTPFIGPGLPAIYGAAVHFLLSVVAGSAAAIWLIRTVGKRVDAITPLRHLMVTWRQELNAPRPDDRTASWAVTGSPTWVEEDPTLTTAHRVESRLSFDDD